MSFVNAALCKTFLYEEEDLVGQNVKILVPSLHKEEHDNYLKPLFEKPVSTDYREVQGMKKNGEKFALNLSLTHFYKDGELFYTGILRDISKQKKLFDEIQRAKQSAEDSVKAKSEFLTIMSHELRTPLHAIISSLQLVESESEVSRQMIDIAYGSAQDLLESLNGILSYVQLESGLDEKAETFFSLARCTPTVLGSFF